MKDNYYDIIIIGAGMSGLYSAYNIKKKSPNTNFLILEKNNKKYIGGRANNDIFYNTKIVTGAGIGRKDTNPLLIKLCKEFNITFKESISVINYSNKLTNYLDITKIIDFLQKKFNENKELYKKMNFKEFATKIIGEEKYKLFVVSTGYTDYENADVYETLYNYGMDDNKGGWKKLSIPWDKLVNEIALFIDYNNIKFSSNVINISKIKDSSYNFEIITEKNIKYLCNKIIVATTIDSIKKLIPSANKKNSLYQQIHGQAFLRLYAKFDKKSNEILKNYISNYTIVTGPLQKIIPINTINGIYMISYSDNNNAKLLKKYIDNSADNRNYLENLIEKTLGISKGTLKIIALKNYYWTIGTHYYEPLHGIYKNRSEFIYKAQHPENNILVVGEVVSDYQGWIEGALRSVKNVITTKWIKENY